MPTFELGGTIAGLDEGFVDVSNGLDSMRLNANPNGLALDEPFRFDTRLPAGVGYDVWIFNDPQG
ncbi:MAG: hypothetical protein OEM00_02140 [Burkholderiaceae bacterium]|nr:hypothetical protein [Burkholderiaceae bacterium]MDH3459776.1 hypothetical protein [Burkholderiaceae bacterium]